MAKKKNEMLYKRLSKIKSQSAINKLAMTWIDKKVWDEKLVKKLFVIFFIKEYVKERVYCGNESVMKFW